MNRYLKIQIWSDGTHCFAEDVGGIKLCPRVRTLRFGTIFLCSLFDKELRDNNGVPSGPGPLMRCDSCKAIEIVTETAPQTIRDVEENPQHLPR